MTTRTLATCQTSGASLASPLEERRLTGSPSLPLATAITGMALLRVWVSANTGLTDDEAYYRLWALVPAMSYVDHPPMTAWMIAAGMWCVGDNPVGIRLAAPLTSLVIPFVLWRTTAILFDRGIAECATWFTLAMPLLAIGGVIVTPDTPSVLFWGLTVWALAELHSSRNANWWLAVGLFSGLGLLSKYVALFLGAGIALWIALLPANWRWLRCWQLWAGGMLAVVVALPVVLWNAQHEWASFIMQFGRVVPTKPATTTYLLEFAGASFGLASPLIAILASWGLWLTYRAVVVDRTQSHAMLAAIISPMLFYLLVHAQHARVQPNWPLPLYPALAICAAIALSAASDPNRIQRLGRAALIIGFLPSGLLYLHALRPIAQSAKIVDPTMQIRGWPQFAADVERLRLVNGAQWIATSSYQITGQLAFQFKSGPQIVQLNERLRYVHLPAVDDAVLRSPAIYVDRERWGPTWTSTLLRKRFGSVKALGNLTRTYHGTTMATYAVYLVADPIASVLSPEIMPRWQ